MRLLEGMGAGVHADGERLAVAAEHVFFLIAMAVDQVAHRTICDLTGVERVAAAALMDSLSRRVEAFNGLCAAAGLALRATIAFGAHGAAAGPEIVGGVDPDAADDPLQA